MKRKMRRFSGLVALCLISTLVFSGFAYAAVIDIKPQIPGSYAEIDSVTLQVGGTTIEQASSQSGVIATTTNSVNLMSLVVYDEELGEWVTLVPGSVGQVTAVLRGFDTGLSTGVGVLHPDGSLTKLSDGKGAFKDALEAAMENTDLNNYVYYDGVGNMPPVGTPDFDLMYQTGFGPDDYIIVMERWGNTHFELVALDDEGEPIADANTLRFGHPSGPAYTMYDWNTGYANSVYQPSQAYALTVAKVSKFFAGTEIDEEDRIVHGFRVDNNGEADIKFMMYSPSDPEPEFGTLGGYKFSDLNGNGEWDEGEPGLGGWTIRLWTFDGKGYVAVDATATGPTGYYRFDELDLDTAYYITEVLKNNWTQTYPHGEMPGSLDIPGHGRGWGPVYANGGYLILNGNGYYESYDFGNEPSPPPDPSGTLIVKVVKTDSGNVAGLPVTISGPINASLTTNASGQVTLVGIYAGTYTANSADTGYTSDGPRSATLLTDSSSAEIVITLTPETPPEPELGAIHGVVQDADTLEVLPGATVTIYGPGAVVYTTVTSDAGGEFHVADVPPGNYTAHGTLEGYEDDVDGPVTVVAGETAEMVLLLAQEEEEIIVPPIEPEQPELPKTGAIYVPNAALGALLMAAGLAVRGRRRDAE